MKNLVQASSDKTYQLLIDLVEFNHVLKSIKQMNRSSVCGAADEELFS